MGVRLRYLGHNLEVPEGQFVIGRSSKCQLSVDDPLISRQHAMLVVSGSVATVEDLGSRNGIQVNGKAVKGAVPLRDGDTIVVGSQTMTIHGITHTAPLEVARRGRLDETMSGVDDDQTSDDTVVGKLASQNLDPDRRVHELSLIAAVADKAFGMNRNEDALRLLERPLRELLERSRGVSAMPSPAASQRAASLAMRLATTLGRGEWVEYVFDLYTARRELLPQPIVDELYTVLRRVRIDAGKLRDYLMTLSETTGAHGPNERFLMSRLEGLEPLLGLK